MKFKHILLKKIVSSLDFNRLFPITNVGEKKKEVQKTELCEKWKKCRGLSDYILGERQIESILFSL